MITINLDNVQTAKYYFSFILECTSTGALSMSNDLNFSDIKVAKIGTFTHGSDDDNESVAYPQSFDITLYVPVQNEISYWLLNMLATYTIELKAYRKTLSGAIIDDTHHPYFSGILDPSSIQADLILSTVELQFVGVEQKAKDLTIANNPYNYCIDAMPSTNNNPYYPVEFVFRDILARNIYTNYYNFTTNSSIKANFIGADNNLHQATLQGTDITVPILGTTKAYLATWNRFLFGSLNPVNSVSPTTASESLTALAKNFGCKPIFLENNKIYLQQRWRNSVITPVLIKHSDIIEKEPTVILPKKGLRATLLKLAHASTAPYYPDGVEQTLVSDYGNVIIDNSGSIKNSELVEETKFIFPYTQTYGSQIVRKGVMASVPSATDSFNVRVNNSYDLIANSFSDNDNIQQALYDLVSKKITNELIQLRYSYRLKLRGTDWRFEDDYRIESKSHLFNDDLFIYAVKHREIDFTANTTELTLVSYAYAYIL